jgi:predicted nucleic acid-binding protein
LRSSYAEHYLVALALEADAAAIVSGDRDLLAGTFTTSPVWTPRQFVNRLA